jgi:hypothetical protein
MSARKEVEASTLKAPSLPVEADPHAVKKRAARVIIPIMVLKTFFI